ncbi:hypothetical protein BCR33DRAFT_714925, partial [Rhizoclosmatium globosum]
KSSKFANCWFEMVLGELAVLLTRYNCSARMSFVPLDEICLMDKLVCKRVELAFEYMDPVSLYNWSLLGKDVHTISWYFSFKENSSPEDLSKSRHALVTMNPQQIVAPPDVLAEALPDCTRLRSLTFRCFRKIVPFSHMIPRLNSLRELHLIDANSTTRRSVILELPNSSITKFIISGFNVMDDEEEQMLRLLGFMSPADDGIWLRIRS